MKISDLVGVQLTELKRTLSINAFKAAHATKSAQAVAMLEDFRQTQQTVDSRSIKPIPHPYAGHDLDLKV